MAPARNATGTTPQPHSNQGLIRSQLARPLHAVVLVHGQRWHARAAAAAAEASWAADGPEGRMHALARYYALPSLSLRDALWEPLGHGHGGLGYGNGALGYGNASASAQRGGRGGSMGGSSSSGGSTDRSGQAVLGQAATYRSWPPTAP
eukprot:scaffold101282_cov48-Phaeocystis_antarctica.AAC.1